MSALRLARTRSSAKTTRGASIFTPMSRGAISARWSTKSKTGSRRFSSRSATIRAAGGIQGAPGCAAKPAHFVDCGGGRDFPHSAGDLPQLAPGQPDFSGAAGGAGRRCAGNLRRGPRYFARLPGRHHHRAGYCGAQRHHADRALSASGTGRRRALRPRADLARRQRTPVTDPDDHPCAPVWRCCR